MAGNVAVIEAAAVALITRAVELDNCGRYTESLTFYESGIQQLLEVLKAMKEEAKKVHFRQKIEQYMNRAETIKDHIKQEKEAGKYHEQIQISSNSTGHSYDKIFSRFLDPSLSEVQVDDPYIRNHHQIINFLRFCELLISSSAKIRKIKLVTGPEDNPEALSTQQGKLEEIKRSLHEHSVSLEITYSPTLHDREIRFNNGWVIKIGRGLDFFKAAQGKFSLGQFDTNLRLCHETTVDVFHRAHTKQS